MDESCNITMSHRSPRRTQKFSKMTTVYKYLSHHYVLKRSIVFIVDDSFSTVDQTEQASTYVTRFFNSMQMDDCFGYINLGGGKDEDEVILEPKGRNTRTKQLFLQGMEQKMSDMFFESDKWKKPRS